MSDFLFFGRIQFDFLQPHYTDDTHVDDQQQIIRLHGAKYRRIVETVVDNPELGMIAGGYFTKYLDGRAQDVDLYISYTGKENPPSDELLNSLLRPKFRSAPFVSSSHLSVLRQKKIVLPGGIGCWVRITTAKSLHEVLATFNWRPAQIGYSFSDHQLLFGPWFRTGGPMYNGKFTLALCFWISTLRDFLCFFFLDLKVVLHYSPTM
jgi:hypothetical protein